MERAWLMPALNKVLMKERKRRIIKRLKDIQEQRIDDAVVSNEVTTMAKEIDRYFQRTLKRIDRAQAEH